MKKNKKLKNCIAKKKKSTWGPKMYLADLNILLRYVFFLSIEK